MNRDHFAVEKRDHKRRLLLFSILSLGAGVWIGLLIKSLQMMEGGKFILSLPGILLGAVIILAWIGYLMFAPQVYKPLRKPGQAMKGTQEGEANDSVRNHENQEQGALLKTVVEVHELMKGHLNNIISETNQAALSLIDQLVTIHGSMGNLDKTVSDNQAQSDKLSLGSRATLENNRETMDNLQIYIDKRMQEIMQDHAAAKELQQQASGMSDLSKLIENVSKQTTIVATNAKIEATRAGKHGQAFGVIADEVTNLSNQIRNSNKQIITFIEQMALNIEQKFAVKLDQEVQKKETEMLTDLQEQLVSMASGYRELENFNRLTFENICSSSAEISSKVNESLSTIQFQDITQQQIEVILKSLNLFKGHLDEAGRRQEVSGEFSIHQIRDLYVMTKQHKIHDDVKGEKQNQYNEDAGEELQNEDITFF